MSRSCMFLQTKTQKQMQENTMPSSQVTVLGRLIAGGIMSHFSESVRGIEMSAPQLVRLGVSNLCELLGPEEAKSFIQGSEQVHHALVYACIDYAVLDRRFGDETKGLIDELMDEEKVVFDLIFMHITGQTKARDGRWAQPLWGLHQFCKTYRSMSPSRITPEATSMVLQSVFWEAFRSVRHLALDMVR